MRCSLLLCLLVAAALVCAEGVDLGTRMRSRYARGGNPYDAEGITDPPNVVTADQMDPAQAYDAMAEPNPMDGPVPEMQFRQDMAMDAEAAPQAPPFVPAVVQPSAAPAASGGLMMPPEPSMRPVGGDKTEAQDAENEDDPELLKLNAAHEAVKQDIVTTAKQIQDERRWSAAVNKIIRSYQEKLNRVQGHIVALRREMKKLYQKKKAIENLKLQRALEGKLKEANDNLAVLQNTLKKVEQKRGQLDKSHMDLRTTIAGIEQQLAKLKGEDKKAEEEAKEEEAKAHSAGAKPAAKKFL